MSNEKYVNYYIEILTSTLTDAVFRNISMQANERISNEIIAEQHEKIELFSNQTATDKQNHEGIIKAKDDVINNLQKRLDDLEKFKSEFENTKHQVQHLDTFRNELNREREAHEKTRNEYENVIADLNKKIDYLQLTPAKRKKIDEANKPREIEVPQQIIEESTVLPLDEIQDGGNF